MTDEFGGIPVEETQVTRDEFGGIAVDQPAVPGMKKKPERPWYQDVSRGIVAGAAHTGASLAKLGEAAVTLGQGHYVSDALKNPQVEALTKPPDTTAGKIGYGGEQLAEFLVPAGVVSKAGKLVEGATAGMRGAKWLSGAGKAAAEGVATGTVAGVQTGSPEEAAKQAATGAAGSGVMQTIGAGITAAGPILKNKLDPIKKAAIDWAEAHGIRLSAGQRSGNRYVQRGEAGLENVLGSSGRAHDFYGEQAEDLATSGRSLINRVSPGRNANPVEAGTGLTTYVRGKVDYYKTQADDMYDALRVKYAANPKTVQVGTEASPVLDASGKPFTTIMQRFELPIDAVSAKNSLRPMYDELMRTMPEARRKSSPGFRALEDIITGPDIMDAVVMDRNLSALKSLARTGNNPYLNSRSQGIAKSAIRNLEEDFGSALDAADPTVRPLLQRARDVVKRQHIIAEALDDLPKEPAVLYARLTTAGDRTFNEMKFINSVAPDEMKQIGRTFLEGLLQHSTQRGGFERAAGTLLRWENVGPETKKLLFHDPAKIKELNEFFLAAKQLTENVNPSGTGKYLQAIGPLFAFVDEIRRTDSSLGDRAKRVSAEVSIIPAASNMLSRVLMTPGGARFLTTAMTAPRYSTAFRQAVAGSVALMTGKKPPRPTASPDGLMTPEPVDNFVPERQFQNELLTPPPVQ